MFNIKFSTFWIISASIQHNAQKQTRNFGDSVNRQNYSCESIMYLTKKEHRPLSRRKGRKSHDERKNDREACH